MQNKRTTRIPEKKRKKNRNANLPGLIACGAMTVILLIVLILLLKPSGQKQQGASPSDTAAPTPVVTPAPSPSPTPVPAATEKPVSDIADPAYAALRPKAREGCLPVFHSIKTTEKVIAVTVDDCYQAENLWAIIRLAEQYGAKLTFFPIGEVALRSSQSEALLYAWQRGFEIENHTFTHNNLYQCSDEELANEIYNQNLALSKILNVEYNCHFLRPMGGDAKNDQRIHAYLRQMGYKGVAHWSESGTRDLDELAKILKPGQIYLFHTTDKDLKRLQYFIPYAVQNGYRLVTLNELFGYPANEFKPLESPAENRPVPTLAPYAVIPTEYNTGSHAYGVLLLQQRLIALGYLENGADGIYGANTEKAVYNFQTQAGLPATGKADVNTQQKLFEETAPRNAAFLY